ncbi:MAG: hypothetical protein P8I03_07665 [Thalassotalea sp.]|nr:hypothetical protein [Thalassotalea sp.]
MANFRKVMEQLNLKNGIEQLQTNISSSSTEHSLALSQAVQQLLTDEDKRITLGENAHQVVRENQGASARSLEVLKRLLATNS